MNFEQSNSLSYSVLEEEQIPQNTQGSLLKLGAFQFIGALIFTYGIISCNDNTFGIMILFSLSLFASNNALTNPAVTLAQLLNGKLKKNQFWVTICGQFLGTILGTMLAFFFIANWINQIPYQDARMYNGLIGQFYGEIIGSTLFFCVVFIQQDDEMKFTDDYLEENIIITLSFQAFRQLAYKSNSLFNPAIALSFELFESIKDGDWSRFEYIWMYIVGPFVGVFTALLLVPTFYNSYYKQKVRYNL